MTRKFKGADFRFKSAKDVAAVVKFLNEARAAYLGYARANERRSDDASVARSRIYRGHIETVDRFIAEIMEDRTEQEGLPTSSPDGEAGGTTPSGGNNP